MANTSIIAAFERMWLHVVAAVGNKSDISHTHDDKYYTEAEIDAKFNSIPTPDVSGQINTHNNNNAAHSDIRNLLNEVKSDKADKATTLSGYGITDAYTKTQVDYAITNIPAITTAEIDAICGASIYAASEVDV